MMRIKTVAILVAMLSISNGVNSQDSQIRDSTKTLIQDVNKDKPDSIYAQPREDQWWQDRHLTKLNEKKSMEKIDLLLIGDSITHSWENGGKEVWARHFSDYATLNLGYSGDRTEHVLWRLENKEVDDISPRVAVMMIGTNNTGHRKDTPHEIAAGIKEILGQLESRLPETKVLLLGIFPRDAKPDGENRKINDATNELIKTFADEERVFYLNINEKFLDDAGNLPKSIMPDALHPNAEGYEIWAKAIKEPIEKLMK